MSCQVVILRGCDLFDFQNLSIVILSEAKDPVQTSSGTNSAGDLRHKRRQGSGEDAKRRWRHRTRVWDPSRCSG